MKRQCNTKSAQPYQQRAILTDLHARLKFHDKMAAPDGTRIQIQNITVKDAAILARTSHAFRCYQNPGTQRCRSSSILIRTSEYI
jgi:hypothetical protein